MLTTSWILDPAGNETLYVKRGNLADDSDGRGCWTEFTAVSFWRLITQTKSLELEQDQIAPQIAYPNAWNQYTLFELLAQSLIADLVSSRLFFKSSMRSSIDATLSSGVPKTSEMLRGDTT